MITTHLQKEAIQGALGRKEDWVVPSGNFQQIIGAISERIGIWYGYIYKMPITPPTDARYAEYEKDIETFMTYLNHFNNTVQSWIEIYNVYHIAGSDLGDNFMIARLAKLVDSDKPTKEIVRDLETVVQTFGQVALGEMNLENLVSNHPEQLEKAKMTGILFEMGPNAQDIVLNPVFVDIYNQLYQPVETE